MAKYLPSNAKKFNVLGRHYSSMDEACRMLCISPSLAGRQAWQEMPVAPKEKRLARKDAILQEWAERAVRLLQMRQDFALGKYSRR